MPARRGRYRFVPRTRLRWVPSAAPGISVVGSFNSGGATDTTSRGATVPAGTQADDVAYIFIDGWQGGADPTLTLPSGFALCGGGKIAAGTGVKSYMAYKRLTGTDSGSYTVSWSASMWTTVQGIVLRGVVTSGDGIGSDYNSATATSTTFASVAVTPTGYSGPFMLWHGYNDSGGTHTPPTSYFEYVDVDCATDAYFQGSGSGSQTASGATVSVSSAILSRLAAVQPATGGGSTSAPAGQAAGTGTAYAPTTTVAVGAGQPAATGAAQTPTALVAAGAGQAAGTGAAQTPTTTVKASAGQPTGTGTAPTPAAAIAVGGGLASGTGTAYDPTVTTGSNTNAPAGNAAGTGTAQTPSTAVAASVGAATGAGVAQAPSVALGVPAGHAAASGTAPTPAASVRPGAGVATGTGAANSPSVAVYVYPSTANGTGTAYQPTVSGSGTGPAGHAAGTGTAYGATVTVRPNPGTANGAGTAWQPATKVTVGAEVATGTGAAPDATTSGAVIYAPGVATPRTGYVTVRVSRPRIVTRTAHHTGRTSP